MYLVTKKNSSKKKVLFFLLVALLTQLTFAATIKSQSTESTPVLVSKNVYELKTLFKAIENQTDYSLLYTDEVAKLKTLTPVSSGTHTLAVLLKEAAIKFKVVYQINDGLITFKTNTSTRDKIISVLAKQIKISGKVTDNSGKPIPGATILIEGTSSGVQTDFDGSYTIEAEEGQILVFSCIGFKTIKQTIGQENKINVVLTEEAEMLKELVITALGIKREEKALGYAMQKVQGSSVQTVKGIDVATSLTGRVAGLLVKNSTEFAEAPTVELRGENALLVIDGVPYGNMTLRDIPADDIESLNVLKGATASALYGYRGASGAIVVTTKKGRDKKGLAVSVNSSTMFTAGYLAIPKTQTVFGRQIDAVTNIYKGTGSWGVPMEGQNVIQWDPISKANKLMPYLATGKDNFKNFLEQGYILNNNFSITQQGEHGSIRSSATWVANKGQYPNSQYDKYTYTLGGDIDLDKFKLSSSVSINKQTSPNIGFNGYKGYDPMYSILIWSSPDYDLRDYKDYWLVKNETQNNSYTGTNNNPYFDRYERLHSIDRQVFNGFVSGTYELAPGLNAVLRTGFDTYNNKQVIRISKGSLQGAGNSTVILNGTEIWGESLKGSYNEGMGSGYSSNTDFILTGNKKIKDFDIESLFGGTIYYTEDQGIEARTQGGLTIPGFYSLKSSVTSAVVNSTIYKRQVNSLYGRLAGSWKSMLFLEGTLRNDWSSTLPKSTRSYLYPSISSSFLVSEILPKYDWLSLWKFRGSWTSSKTPAGVYDSNSVYNITTSAWGSSNSASYPDTVRGNEVAPESSSTWEVGTVANLFKKRASLDFTFYSKRMFDFLKATSVSSASGFSSNYTNINEEITRRGLELTLSVTPVKTTDWQWDLTANWSKYARYYTKLDSQFSADKPWVKVGERADAFVLNEFLKDGNGNMIYENGLPVYSAYESVHGYADPDWIWGLTSSLRYKDFTLNISMDGRVGGLAQTTTEMYMWQSGNHPDSVNDIRYKDATTGTSNYLGDGVKVVSGNVIYNSYGEITSDTRQYAANDVYVTYENYVKRVHKGNAWGGTPSPYDTYSTTFLKLRELSLTYVVPQRACHFIRAKSASISAIGQNLFLWAKDFKYSDPDGGSDNFSDPSQRFVGCNVKLEF
ncbi:TonB-linked SusC/RagA family outer membrane protein [Flavobacterium sp. 1]|uniref:SusC/RagA family TonB-linked outer membrane protein n=1 Tax=Flavobacterium sp. 1 TaxID=2035200 RepID=UPI000C242884|nr:SusC/RagA family TonB-linked outer membrane protein [Flavobacterium sp. 1]PJJ07811.1 TonB-linked SusC/RagA family outer membrane protein [Flavobacterium sp. 1]